MPSFQVRIQENMRKSKSNRKKQKQFDSSDSSGIQFTEDKIQAMKNLAAQIAKSMSQTQKKTSIQLELEEERKKKIEDRKELKKLTPQGLLHYNHDKAKTFEDTSINKIDDSEAKVEFSEALEYSKRTAILHQALVSGKIKEPVKIKKKADELLKKVTKEDDRDPLEKYKKKYGERNDEKRKKKKRDKRKTEVDHSGIVDGEEVEGLVKTETKKIRGDKKQDCSEAQDNFVLGRLFQKKGK